MRVDAVPKGEQRLVKWSAQPFEENARNVVPAIDSRSARTADLKAFPAVLTPVSYTSSPLATPLLRLVERRLDRALSAGRHRRWSCIEMQ